MAKKANKVQDRLKAKLAARGVVPAAVVQTSTFEQNLSKVLVIQNDQAFIEETKLIINKISRNKLSKDKLYNNAEQGYLSELFDKYIPLVISQIEYISIKDLEELLSCFRQGLIPKENFTVLTNKAYGCAIELKLKSSDTLELRNHLYC